MENNTESPWVLERAVIGGLTRLCEGVTTIGRSDACTITIASSYVSRIHAELDVAPGSEVIHITDLGSTNGVFVNDELYNKEVCRLQVGDRIGIGVSVEDDQVSPDGQFPIFILRHVPLIEDDKVDEGESKQIGADRMVSGEEVNESVECIQLSDNEDDEDDDKDDFVQLHEMEDDCMLAAPSVSIAALNGTSKNIVSENIQSIFGDFNEELLEKLSKDARQIAEANTSKHVPVTVIKEDVICISSDEECDGDRINSAKSPQLFGDSFNNDEVEEKQEEVAKETSKDLPRDNTVAVKVEIESRPEAASSKVDNVDDNEEEELYFTQNLFNDLKEELSDSDNEDVPNYSVDDSGALIISPIKQEKLTEDVDDIINLDDDDEYDEALETKVKGWSFKLCSQSFSNSFNMSQVYEDDLDSAPAANTEGIFVNIDDSDEEKADNNQRDEKIEQDVGIEPLKRPTVSRLTTPPSSEKEDEECNELTNCKDSGDKNESPILRQWKRSMNKKFLFSSSSSEEENFEEIKVHVNKEQSMSSSTRNKDKDLHPQKLSTIDEIPKKKPRLTSESEGQKEKATVRQQSSSSSKSYSRKSSKRQDSHSSFPKQNRTVEDLFDQIKNNEKHDRSSSESDKHSNKPETKRESSDSSIKTYRRSSSAADATTAKSYMSATVARRKSLGHHSFEEDTFEEVKKPEPLQTAQTKCIRGPPVIIQPPQLPSNKNKLRGVPAVQQKCINTLKNIHQEKELKRKWIEKPSVDKRKDKEKSAAIKEDRKQKLKELADKHNSDTTSTNAKVKTRENDRVSGKPKVKLTSVNRGAFLANDISAVGKNSYRIPKTNNNPCTSKSNTKSGLTSTKPIDERKSSTEVPDSFTKELLKADAVLKKSTKQAASISGRDRSKSSDSEQKERAPRRRNDKKLTFDAMEHHFQETNRLKNIQQELATGSIMKGDVIKQKKKKTVRFNDVPEIRYIEPVLNATRKVDKKETSTFNDRRILIRRRFPLVDHTDDLLSHVLSWSQLWLQNKKAGVSMDGSDGMIFPMTNQFTSIDNYKSTVFPLLKIEYLSHLERHMERYASKPGYHIKIENFSNYKDKELIMARCSSQIKQSELGVNDLALIDVVVGTVSNQYFGYVGHIRKGEKLTCITLEVSPNLIDKEMVNSAPIITLRRIMEGIRVYFGSFNAVHQLEQTPLFKKILNPLDLLNDKSRWRPSIQYKGCDPLNEEQKDILLKTYAKTIDEYNSNISLIQGPPGTGKSRLITNLALQLLYGNEVRMLDKKVLICAQSNMAVDVIAQQLLAIQKKLSPRAPKYHVIRFGKDEKIHKNVRDITVSKLIERHQKARLYETNGLHEQHTLGENLKNEILKLEARVMELEKENFQDVRQDELVEIRKNLALKKSIQDRTLRPEDEKRLFTLYLEQANIICTTLSSCVKLSFYVNYFDVCIIDEATQCIEPWTIMPLKFGVSSLVLVGDTQQLPATVISQKAKAYGLGTSLFTRIQNCLENRDSVDPSPIFTLHTQYRMHPEICKWPNLYFYKNQLLNASSTAEFKSKIKPFSILNLEYTQNEHCHNGQIANSHEAEFVVKLVKILDQYIPNKFYSYGIITPYAQHREKLEVTLKTSGLPDIMVNTIDSYQGIEKDVIIISNARTQGIGFLANYQRLNVALTRPKKCLILCGNFKNLESVPSWASLLSNARERGLFHDISIADALDIDNNVIEKIKIKR